MGPMNARKQGDTCSVLLPVRYLQSILHLLPEAGPSKSPGSEESRSSIMSCCRPSTARAPRDGERDMPLFLVTEFMNSSSSSSSSSVKRDRETPPQPRACPEREGYSSIPEISRRRCNHVIRRRFMNNSARPERSKQKGRNINFHDSHPISRAAAAMRGGPAGNGSCLLFAAAHSRAGHTALFAA